MVKYDISSHISLFNVCVIITALLLIYSKNLLLLLCLSPALLLDSLIATCSRFKHTKKRKDKSFSGFSQLIYRMIALGLGVIVYCLIKTSLYLPSHSIDSTIFNKSQSTERIISDTDKTNSIRSMQLRKRKSDKSVNISRNITENLIHLVNINDDPSVYIPLGSYEIISKVFGSPIPITHPDFKYRTPGEVRTKLRRVFTELPVDGFSKLIKNPCWNYDNSPVNIDENGVILDDLTDRFTCLPYAYILGQPKCGTSDLFERIKRHPQVVMPARKEIRWFTRGEFTTQFISREGEFPSPYKDPERTTEITTSSNHKERRRELMLGPESSLRSFTGQFNDAIKQIFDNPLAGIVTIDGGPHTFWWSTQNSDGSFSNEEVSIVQMIREIQPNTKFIVTLSDPVRRMYSDYYFLEDSLRPVNPRSETHKSAEEFHSRVTDQVNRFNLCVIEKEQQLQNELDIIDDRRFGRDAVWLRASQICAHDRHEFAVGGWGRLSIGLYSLYLEKWLEHFPLNKFLFLRLEDYETEPKEYMARVFRFLDLSLDDVDWGEVTTSLHFNENHYVQKDPIREDSEIFLRKFYEPYNRLLARVLEDDSYLWNSSVSLRSQLLIKKEADFSADANIRDHRKRKTKDHRSVFHSSTKNQHAAFRHEDSHSPFEEGVPDEEERDETFIRNLRPHSFNISDLPTSDIEDFNGFIRENVLSRDSPPTNTNTAAEKLCYSSFALDINALKFLLYDYGVSADLVVLKDAKRTALHCLALIHTMIDAHPKSQVFALLKGLDTWLSNYIVPPLPLKESSVLASDVIDGVADAVVKAAKWLIRAGVTVGAIDAGGFTVFHQASIGGLYSLLEALLEGNLLDSNYWTNQKITKVLGIKSRQGRTALHYAVVNGHAKIAGLLYRHGANLDEPDDFGVTPRDIASVPGPLFPGDALKYLNIVQRDPKLVPLDRRKLEDSNRGSGGWGKERLKGFEFDYGCDVDQYEAHEITGKQIFTDYIARNIPVLIRGLIDDWGVRDMYTRENLTELFGGTSVEVSDIPYASKFGGSERIMMTLSEYIDEVREHRMVGGVHPWYVFKGNPIPKIADSLTSIVPYDKCPTPEMITEAFKETHPNEISDHLDVNSRQMFVNAQWALGGEGTGAPVHYHNTAWNALVYGAKKWAIYPPHYTIMSNKQILDYFETDMKLFHDRGIPTMTCIQMAGDVMIIPETWGHGVLNIEESVAIASEAKNSHWRYKPGTRIIGSLPFDNRVISK